MRIGLYPGTFDPVTCGHIDIVTRAARLVDRLVIGVAVSGGKGPLFSLEERCELLTAECAGVAEATGIDIAVRPFDGLLLGYAHEVGAALIVRGLRAVSDFDYEFQMVGMNRAMDDGIETVFLMADAQYQPVASRLVKEVARFGGDVSPFVPPRVEAALRAKYAG